MELIEIFRKASEDIQGSSCSPADVLSFYTDRKDLVDEFNDFLESMDICACDNCGTFVFLHEPLNAEGVCWECSYD